MSPENPEQPAAVEGDKAKRDPVRRVTQVVRILCAVDLCVVSHRGSPERAYRPSAYPDLDGAVDATCLGVSLTGQRAIAQRCAI